MSVGGPECNKVIRRSVVHGYALGSGDVCWSCAFVWVSGTVVWSLVRVLNGILRHVAPDPTRAACSYRPFLHPSILEGRWWCR